VLNAPLLLPGANKRRYGRFSRLGQTLGLDQKQFAFPEFEERFATLGVGTSAEHFLTAFWSAKNSLAEQLEFKSGARRLPWSSYCADLSFPACGTPSDRRSLQS
jgi:hypothetical protein